MASPASLSPVSDSTLSATTLPASSRFSRSVNITRWRIEDTIRHVKQSYNLEDMRLFKYGKIKALAAIVLATTYFSMAWIVNSENHTLCFQGRDDSHASKIGEPPRWNQFSLCLDMSSMAVDSYLQLSTIPMRHYRRLARPPGQAT